MAQNVLDDIVTTRPIIPPHDEYPVIVTADPRIVLRPYRIDDVNDLHELRSQIAVMKWTSTGKVDEDVHKTQNWMKRFMKAEDDSTDTIKKDVDGTAKELDLTPTTFCFVIVYREDSLDKEAATASSASKVIGATGCHTLSPDPEFGYMIRQEYWGQGIATAVARAYLEFYWKLERRTVRLSKVVADSGTDQSLPVTMVDTQDRITTREQLKAITVATNSGSRRVLEKCAFQQQSSEVVSEDGAEVTLLFYYLSGP